RALLGIAAALDGIGTRLPGPDSHDVVNCRYPDLAVTDLVGTRRLGDRVDDTRDGNLVDENLDLDLRGEGHGVLGAAVHLSVALLATEALRLSDGHPVGPDRLESGLNLIESERLDDRSDEHHRTSPASVGSDAVVLLVGGPVVPGSPVDAPTV